MFPRDGPGVCIPGPGWNRKKEGKNVKIECIHFDLDSVLYIPIDFLENALRLVVGAMVEHGLQASMDAALDKLHQIRRADSNARDHFNRLCLHFNGNEDPIIIAAGVEKFWDCKAGGMITAPGAYNVLEQLSRNYPLTIISNGPPVKQAGKVTRLGLARFFSGLKPQQGIWKHSFYATDDPARAKPKPDLWETARDDLRFSYEKCLMIGDRYWTDMLGAKRLGMTTVKINQGEHRHEKVEEVCAAHENDLQNLFDPPLSRKEAARLMQPDFTIHNLAELLDVVNLLEKRN
jgi:FMN phosphatase YigB (HAD superfamily)